MTINRRDFISLSDISIAGAIGGCSKGEQFGEAVFTKKFDVCVIDSGFAGIALAQRTCENKMHTAVIEAGGSIGGFSRFFSSSREDTFKVKSTGSILPV